jgi:hypothetical protein
MSSIHFLATPEVQAESANLFVVQTNLKASKLTPNGVKFYPLKGESNQLLGEFQQPRIVLGLTVTGNACETNGVPPALELVAYDNDSQQIVSSLVKFYNPIPIYQDPKQITIEAVGVGGSGVVSADWTALITLNYETCTSSVHPGRATSVEISPLGSIRPTGTPSYPGPILPDQSVLQILSDSPVTPAIYVSLSGIASAPNSAPQLNAAPSPLTFGTVQVGTNRTLTITLRNNGGSTCAVTSIARNGSAAFTYTPTGPLNIAPGASTTVTVTFTPWAAGADNAILQISSNDPKNPVQYINLSGNGSTTAPCSIRVSPSQLLFGTVEAGTNSIQTLNLINSGGETCTVDRITLLTQSTSFSFFPTNTPISVPPAGTSVVSVVYAPIDATSATGVLQIDTENDDAHRLLQVNLSGAGALPQCRLAIGPSSLAFGSVIVETNRSLSISITNNSLVACTVSNIAITGGAGFSVVNAPSLPFSVPPGNDINLMVDFAPTTGGTNSATLTISYADPTQTATISLSGTGVAVATNCDFSVTSQSFNPAPVLDYGDVAVGATNMLKVQVSNQSLSNCTIQTLVMGGSTNFHLIAPVTPITVSGAGMVEIAVSYVPTAAGSDVGTLQIYKDAANPSDSLFVVGLQGNGVRPGIVVDTTPVNFGGVLVGTSSTLSVLVANTNSVPCTITSLSISGSSDFTVDPIVPRSQFILGPNTMVEIPIVYDPSVMGTGTATLVINSNDPASPAQVALKGIGLQSRLVVSPTAIAFGTLTLGATNTVTLTISNTGNTNCTLSDLEILANSAFTLDGAVAPITIAAGTNVTVDVNYRPVSAETILILDGTIKTKGNSSIISVP